MPKYKNGKITEQLSFQYVQERVLKVKKKLTLEALAFFWLLYYVGCRKSEAYERTVDDCQLTEQFFIIDFHQRKKHGATVPALKLPLNFPGVETLSAQILAARKKRTSRKLFEKTVKGDRSTEYKRAHWLFPHIQKQWALHIIKTILGENYYPHFLRLNRITEICSDPTANITRIKSFTGIKTLRVIESYMGSTEKEQDAALDFMAKQIKPNKQKNTRK